LASFLVNLTISDFKEENDKGNKSNAKEDNNKTVKRYTSSPYAKDSNAKQAKLSNAGNIKATTKTCA